MLHQIMTNISQQIPKNLSTCVLWSCALISARLYFVKQRGPRAAVWVWGGGRKAGCGTMPSCRLLGQTQGKFGVELGPRRVRLHWKRLPNRVICTCSARTTPSHLSVGSLDRGRAGWCVGAGGLLGEMCTCGGGDGVWWWRWWLSASYRPAQLESEQ